jgi:hypothetical protein
MVRSGYLLRYNTTSAESQPTSWKNVFISIFMTEEYIYEETRMMQGARAASVTSNSPLCITPQKISLHNHCYGNLKSYTMMRFQ